MADKIIDVIPVGTSQTDFRQIKLVDKGDYFQIWRNGITYVGDIQEQAEAELWADARSQGWTTGFLNIHFCPRCSRELEEELFS